ncbi:MAG: rRNA maturation RNase YbeY, partial [Alphaproteobacteria bacterium]
MTRNAALAALASTAETAAAELAVVLADDVLLRSLNSAYRGVDKATNVLAFAYADSTTSQAPFEGDVLGDVVISLERAAEEAKDSDISLSEHLSHLVIHGVLHLLGHDHITDGDAKTMEELEIRTLAVIGIANPYAPHSAVK